MTDWEREVEAEMEPQLRGWRKSLSKSKPDINIKAYMLAQEIARDAYEDRHQFLFGKNGRSQRGQKILPELATHQHALRPNVRRYLINQLRHNAEACRQRSQEELQKAQRWDQLAGLFGAEMQDVTAPRKKTTRVK